MKAFDSSKNKLKIVRSIGFWNVSIYTLKVYSVYTIHWDKTQINRTKNAFFLLLGVPTHHSFTFDSPFLYDLKHKARVSKSMRGIFHFRFPFSFLLIFIFLFNKRYGFWLYTFAPRSLFFLSLMTSA